MFRRNIVTVDLELQQGQLSASTPTNVSGETLPTL
jgi:hypothetical protein